MWARVKTSTPKSFSTRFAEVETLRSCMLRFATAKLRDAEQAEEIVLVSAKHIDSSAIVRIARALKAKPRI